MRASKKQSARDSFQLPASSFQLSVPTGNWLLKTGNYTHHSALNPTSGSQEGFSCRRGGADGSRERNRRKSPSPTSGDVRRTTRSLETTSSGPQAERPDPSPRYSRSPRSLLSAS